MTPTLSIVLTSLRRWQVKTIALSSRQTRQQTYSSRITYLYIPTCATSTGAAAHRHMIGQDKICSLAPHPMLWLALIPRLQHYDHFWSLIVFSCTGLTQAALNKAW